MWTTLFFYLLSYYATLLSCFTIFRKYITYRGLFFTTVVYLFIFLNYLIYIFNPTILCNAVSALVLPISNCNWLSLEFAVSFKLDGLSYLFVLLVLVIGLSTNFYSLNYFKYEASEDIFTLLINWFMLSMLFLVLANNLFTLFLGWESIGLSSFFLINFWQTRRGTIKSSFKALVFNKISDVFLFLAIMFLNTSFHVNSLDFINMLTDLYNTPTNAYTNTSTLCLLGCALFKSAQIFGHLWLPDSMEAPVPASALIHSATLVSAGIFILLRFTSLITLNSLQPALFLIGSLTAAYGGIVAASQTDMKKLLAYSTISHCGFLFAAVATEVYGTAIIYLFLHGIFKALTFFCAGTFIRVAGSQDTRQMGALSRIIPVDTIFLVICAINLGGLPFSLGYLYKTTIISSTLAGTQSPLVIGLLFCGLISSLVYTYRLVYYSAFDTPKEFFLSIMYELQQKQIDVTKFWSLSTYVQIIAVTVLGLFSCWVYILFSSYFIYSELTLDHNPITFTSINYLLSVTPDIYKSFYEMFYAVYILVGLSISIIFWRHEYTASNKLTFIVNIHIIIIVLTVYSKLVI